ncbi:conserved hypothetical protein [Trichinella spiralis]|uniref:hypothetical protein n=1 Tax=Trichinella spiralis TaxID=6334 RepID=UPI0001EFC70B|nr:conserved hypothetical protein [Trichinella spiralis]
MIFKQAQVCLAHRSRPTLPPSWQMDLKQRWIDILDLLLCQFVGQRLPVHASLHRLTLYFHLRKAAALGRLVIVIQLVNYLCSASGGTVHRKGKGSGRGVN